VTPLINATAAFTPTAGSNVTSTDVEETLATLCESNGCADSAIRGWLSGFYSNCSAELTSSTAYNAQVRELYDVLYVVNPLRDAVCAIDSGNQDFCVKSITSGSSSSSNLSSNSTTGSGSASASASASGSVLLSNFAATWSPVEVAANNLYIAVSVPVTSVTKRFVNMISRQEPAQATFASIITPNMTTYRNTNLPFLFLQPNMKASSLCTPCTREVMVSYIKWETAFPYALGLSQSPILGGQSELWNAINATCGQGYVKAITSEVGITANAFNSSSNALSRFGQGSSGVGSIVAGAAIVAGAVALLV
jgi:hypothetical protein